MPVVYLDNNATTKVDPEVLQAMLPYFSDYYGNPSSMHAFGGGVAGVIREARERLARLIGASPEEIVFTSCGTESDSTAIRAVIESYPSKRHLVTSRVEHPAVKNLFETFAKKGYRTTFVPVDGQGRLDLDYLYDQLSEDTALVSIMWANNETGVLFPVEEVSRAVKERGIVFHTDAVQAVGKVPIDLAGTGIDMLSLSGHKLHAPKGIGALYIRKGTKFAPYLIGGHQERGRRGGTENTAAIVGLGKAAELAAHHIDGGSYRGMSELRDRLEQALLSTVPNTMVNGDPAAPPAEHEQHRLRVRRGRGHPAHAERARNLRLLGLGLHLRLARALPRAARHGGTVHGGPRLDPLQPQPVHDRLRNRPRPREAPADHRAAAGAIALLEERRKTGRSLGQGITLRSTRTGNAKGGTSAPRRTPLVGSCRAGYAFGAPRLAAMRARSHATQGSRPSPVWAEISKIGIPGWTWRM